MLHHVNALEEVDAADRFPRQDEAPVGSHVNDEGSVEQEEPIAPLSCSKLPASPQCRHHLPGNGKQSADAEQLQKHCAQVRDW